MKFYRTYFLIALIDVMLWSFLSVKLHAQKPFYFPSNIPIPDTLADGAIISGNKYANNGFRSLIPEPEFQTKELVWKNAPIILDGHTIDFTRNRDLYYPGLNISDTIQYYIVPFLVYNMYKGNVEQDTIRILQRKLNYNINYPPTIHNCDVFVVGSLNARGILFLRPIAINEKQYYISCNHYYEGWEYVVDLNYYIDNYCSNKHYTKSEIMDLLKSYDVSVEQRPTETGKKFYEEKSSTKN